MKTTRKTRSKIPHTERSWIDSHVDLILELPEPGIDYRFRDLWGPKNVQGVRHDLPKTFVAYRQMLQQMRVIRKVNHVNTTDEMYSIWQTDADVWRYIQEKRDGQTTFPCGHLSGFETIDADAEIYQCGYEYCHETFGRDTVEEVMG